jgi:hypothetical protein
MGILIKKIHFEKQCFLNAIQEEFSRIYPFLRIEFVKRNENNALSEDSAEEEGIREEAVRILREEVRISDEMSICDMEALLQDRTGFNMQTFRKSGNLWMGTRKTRHWTLGQQNDHGEDIASGY